MENIWNIYGMAALIIILYSVVGKLKGNKLRNLWISYIVVGFLLLGLDVFKTKKDNDANNDNYLVYILKSDKYSYVGMTNDFFKRWRQHNQEIKGGAKYTSKREEWYPVCIVDGFKTMKEAMQCVGL